MKKKCVVNAIEDDRVQKYEKKNPRKKKRMKNSTKQAPNDIYFKCKNANK